MYPQQPSTAQQDSDSLHTRSNSQSYLGSFAATSANFGSGAFYPPPPLVGSWWHLPSPPSTEQLNANYQDDHSQSHPAYTPNPESAEFPFIPQEPWWSYPPWWLPPPWWLHPPTEPIPTDAEPPTTPQADYPPQASDSEQLQHSPQPTVDEYPMQYQSPDGYPMQYQSPQSPMNAYGYSMQYQSAQTQPMVDAYGYPMQYHMEYPLHETQGDGENFPPQPFMTGSYGDLFDSTLHIPPPWWSSSQPQLVANDGLPEEEESSNDYSVQDENWSRNQESRSSPIAEISSSVKEEFDSPVPLQPATTISG